jgi:hypothetical protein
VCCFAVSCTQKRNEAIAAGTWRADTGPVRLHVRSLMVAGMGYKRVAALAGVAESTVSRILYGRRDRGTPPPKTIRYDLAQKLLAVELDLAPGTNIEASGTVRRGQALHALGYTLTEIAERIGWTVQNFCGILHRGAVPYALTVTVRTAQDVGRVYDELAMHRPTGPAADAAREHARRAGWFPPLAWDDDTIDDPNAQPCMAPPVDGSDPDVNEVEIQRAVAGFEAQLTWREKLEVVRRVPERPSEELAALLGVAVKSLSTMRSLHLPQRQAS